MQIYPNSQINTPGAAGDLSVTPAQQGRTPPKTSYPATHNPGDQVQLSSLATHAVAQLAANLETKIGKLQSAIDAGTYGISPRAIAKSMMDESRGFFA